MDQSKSVWASKAVWGSLMVIIVAVAQIAGYDIGAADGWAEGIVGLIGGALAMYGRVKAVKKIGK
jgi:hypothetical protein